LIELVIYFWGMNQSEHHTQVACVNWFSMQYPKYKALLFAIPNGGKRSIGVARKMKAEGVKKGVPDLFFALPNDGYHGLFIEMKSATGSLSSDQKMYLKMLHQNGYRVEVCKSFDNFKVAIESYLVGVSPVITSLCFCGANHSNEAKYSGYCNYCLNRIG